jgi:predicted ATPase
MIKEIFQPPPGHVLLSGCSGGGKSTILRELSSRGFRTVAEPGRRIVQEELLGDGKALPWVDLAAFARRALVVAAEDREGFSADPGWIFFDRGLIDAAVALEHATGQPATSTLAGYKTYHRKVFVTPPWPEIYINDPERTHSLQHAVEEYDRLLPDLEKLGYVSISVPRTPVIERVDFILQHLS